MARKGTGILLVTANVGSLFEDPDNLQKTWLQEFYKTVHTHKPYFVALHCQEVGGKNADKSKDRVKNFFHGLMFSDSMKDYNRACVYLDADYESIEKFTALGSCYFIHESLTAIQQFDFNAKKFKKVVGKEIIWFPHNRAEKEKFPAELCSESLKSRKGFIRTRWIVRDCAFDLVNIHLFHDASNLVAWEKSPSDYSLMRQKALEHVLNRITDQRYIRVPYFLFGDFNFRLDFKEAITSLCSTATIQKFQNAEKKLDKLIFQESDNDHKVVLQIEKKLFDYNNQDVFRENNGTLLLQFDKEKAFFVDRLHELDISFPPSYPYSEKSNQGKQYMNTRCPAWCDRILMSSSAQDLVVKPEPKEKSITNIGPKVCTEDHKPEIEEKSETNDNIGPNVCMEDHKPEIEEKSETNDNIGPNVCMEDHKPEIEEKSITYDNIGPNVCMGDHKPVFLSFQLTPGAGKPYANMHKCCVMQ